MSSKEKIEGLLENLTPRTFRASALVLERISRWNASLDYVFSEVRKEFKLTPGEARTVYFSSRNALLDIGLSIYVLEKLSLIHI